MQEGELRLRGFHLSTGARPISNRKAILGSGAEMERNGGLGLRLLEAAA